MTELGELELAERRLDEELADMMRRGPWSDEHAAALDRARAYIHDRRVEVMAKRTAGLEPVDLVAALKASLAAKLAATETTLAAAEDAAAARVEEAAAEQAVAAVVDQVATYLALKEQIGELEGQAGAARETIVAVLMQDGPAPGTVWELPGLAIITVVKGRTSEKLDRGKLARAGVSAEVLDAATVRTEGEPSLRIVAAEEAGE